MKTIALIGSTGSIGRQVCNVVRRYPEKFKIESLVANSSVDVFLQQVREFMPAFAALADEETGRRIADQIPSGVKFAYGESAAVAAIGYGEVAFVAATGFAGLKYSLAAIEQKKSIALANKETLVCGGELVMGKIKGAGIDLMPVDSEHSALWQALHFRSDAKYRRLIITASGGPFYSYTAEQLKNVTPASALKHPTWKMGAKITIDSATLMNKGFEVIEASHLFGITGDKIDVLVHRESIIHSMVEYCDNSVIAQLSVPDMRLCVQYAIEDPIRREAVIPPLDLAQIGSLSFARPDIDTFIPLKLAEESLLKGGAASAILHAANEVAVARFLEDKITFTDIFDTLEYVCGTIDHSKYAQNVSSILEAVRDSADKANEYLSCK